MARAAVARLGSAFVSPVAGRSRRVVAALVAAAAAGGIGWTATWLLSDLPPADRLVERAAPATTKLYDREGRLLHEVLDPRAGRRTRIEYEALPESLVHAVVAIEDAAFFEHPGVDARAILRAVVQAVREGQARSGASTITQQLARQVLMTPDERAQRTLARKAREAVLSLQIERAYDKRTILELYVNEIYFGQLAYGVEAAARTYFGKPAHTLDLAESALLAGLIQSPAAYNPLIDLDAARARQHQVLARMEHLGLIGAEERRAAESERLRLVTDGAGSRAPHFSTWVIGRLEADFGTETVAAGGLNVVTSLDLDLQRLAEASVRQHLAALAADRGDGIDHNAGNGALVAIDPSGGDVLAFVGSAGVANAAIDGAVNMALAPRQPGSAYKPVVYAAAMDPGRWGLRPSSLPGGRSRLPFTPGTVISDVPTTFTTRQGEPYRPQNYDRKWRGPLDLRTALGTSSNMVAVKVLDAIGVEAAIEAGEDLGIRTFVDRDRYGLALALGGAEVRLLELTAAYGAFAAGGRLVTPRPILAVLDEADFNRWMADHTDGAAPGTTAERAARLAELPGAAPAAPRRPALDARVAYLVTDILADEGARLPAFGEGSPLALSRPAAAKTGTTTNFRDNWTIGYTPDLVTGVWIGNADNSPMERVTGISGAGPIWRAFMEAAHAGRPARDFPRPPGLVEVEICAPSGLVPTALCARRVRELFVRGTEPVDLDDRYVRLAIEPVSGTAWSEGCLGTPVERTFLRVPPEAEAWAIGRGIAPPPRLDCLGRPVAAAGAFDERGAGAAGADGQRGAGATGAENQRGAGATGAGGVGPPVRAGAPGGAAPAPLVHLTRPAAGSTFAISPEIPLDAQRIPLEAVAGGGGAPIRRVRFFVGDELVATSTDPPWRAAWRPAEGHHLARAEAETVGGQIIPSAPVPLDVVTDIQTNR